MFDRTPNLQGAQIISYRTSPDAKWSVLIGITAGAPERCGATGHWGGGGDQGRVPGRSARGARGAGSVLVWSESCLSLPQMIILVLAVDAMEVEAVEVEAVEAEWPRAVRARPHTKILSVCTNALDP